MESLTPVSATRPQPPDIRKYDDYRAYLGDYYAFKKALRPGFSHRQFSALARLRSPNYLLLVMRGERNLSLELAARLAKAMGLGAHEREYFVGLVQVDGARNAEDLEQAKRDLLAASRKLATAYVPSAQTQILSRWHHLLVRETVFLPNFEPSGEWISKQLSGLVNPRQAEESFAMLLNCGFIERSAEGIYRAADPVLDTGNRVFREALNLQFHAETLSMWSQNMGQLSPAQQERGLLNIPIDSAKLPELRARILRFQDEIIGWLQDEKKPDRIVQVGVYMIPFGEDGGPK